MKKKHIVLVILMFAVSHFSFIEINKSQSQLSWLSIEEMQEAQLVEQRKVLVDIYADWCFWCKKMEVETLNQEQIIACLTENYYLVKFNPEDVESVIFKDEKYTQREFEYSNSNKSREINSLAIEWLGKDFVYPSIVILDENLNKLSVFDGYKTAKDLDPILNYFSSNLYSKTKWSIYLKNYKSTIND